MSRAKQNETVTVVWPNDIWLFSNPSLHSPFLQMSDDANCGRNFPTSAWPKRREWAGGFHGRRVPGGGPRGDYTKCCPRAGHADDFNAGEFDVVSARVRVVLPSVRRGRRSRFGVGSHVVAGECVSMHVCCIFYVSTCVVCVVFSHDPCCMWPHVFMYPQEDFFEPHLTRLKRAIN